MNKFLSTVLLILLAAAWLPACVKKNERLPSGSQSQQQYIPMGYTAQDEGAVHNMLILQYDSLYGLVPPDGQPMSYNEVYEMVKRFTLIAKTNHLFTIESIDEYAEAVMTEITDAGYFTTAGTLKSRESIALINLQSVENPVIRQAFSDINNYSGPAEGFVPYAQNRLAALPALTPTEQQLVDGFGSVLGSSMQLWSGPNFDRLSATQQAVVIAKADALGHAYGAARPFRDGTWIYGPTHIAMVSAYWAGYMSAAATRY